MFDLTPFVFEEKHSVRVVIFNDEPWIVLSDVLNAMNSGTKITDAKSSIEEGLGEGFVSNVPLYTLGGRQNVYIINEPAVTFLVARSRTENGKRLNRWIHCEVLPSIRRTGRYEFDQASHPSIPALEYVKLMRADLPNLGERSLQQLYSEASQIDLGRRLIPLPVISESFYTAGEFAKEFGISAMRIGKVANAHGLKAQRFGEYRLSKSPYGNKQVEQFFYNPAGREALAEALGGIAQ